MNFWVWGGSPHTYICVLQMVKYSLQVLWVLGHFLEIENSMGSNLKCVLSFQLLFRKCLKYPWLCDFFFFFFQKKQCVSHSCHLRFGGKKLLPISGSCLTGLCLYQISWPNSCWSAVSYGVGCSLGFRLVVALVQFNDTDFDCLGLCAGHWALGLNKEMRKTQFSLPRP